MRRLLAVRSGRGGLRTRPPQASVIAHLVRKRAIGVQAHGGVFASRLRTYDAAAPSLLQRPFRNVAPAREPDAIVLPGTVQALAYDQGALGGRDYVLH